ncbi:MAG TPA: glycerol-3-phosphate 1-O-acyltransferase PlsY [Acidobacteriota bacterium]|nr:glycerol-3-phosphate 1-O-acyltransferase PlsY [Acidobacteriota bacterium]
MDELKTILPVLAAYLLGAVPFGLIVARVFGVSDLRSRGSGNIGATNVWRVLGPGAAVWVYVLDIGKGIAVVLTARQIDQVLLSRDLFLICCAVAAIIGHVFPVYLGFKGGKGVNTALGAMITLLPVEVVICLGLFVLVVLTSRYVSLGSLAAGVALPVVLAVEKTLAGRGMADVYQYAAVLVAILVVVTHRGNIRRLLSGTENRFSFSSREGGAGSRGR